MTRFLFLLDFYILSYDAWGALRNPATHAVLTTAQNLELNRGYCGHEHLTNFGIINMNARLYDPYLGRFLSPDPYVQEPNNTQSLNRYTYCLNNPLKYTDPSGEIFLEYVCGFIKGVIKLFKGGKWYDPFKFGWDNVRNEFKLINGLFKGNYRQIASRFTIELPNTIAGFLYSKFRNIKDNNSGEGIDIQYYNGATFVTGEGDGAGLTLGSYINVWPHYYGELYSDEFIEKNKGLYIHEYGHYIQSQMYGILYIPLFGIPSLISAAGKGNHKKFYTEKHANRLSFLYFRFESEVEWDQVTTPPNGIPYPLY